MTWPVIAYFYNNNLDPVLAQRTAILANISIHKLIMSLMLLLTLIDFIYESCLQIDSANRVQRHYITR